MFFNKDNAKGRSDEEKRIRDHLASGRKDRAMTGISMLKHHVIHSTITQCFRPVLLKWWRKVRDRTSVWSEDVLAKAPDGANEAYYLPHFHRYALEGVAAVLEVLADHWDDEISWESWTGPTSSYPVPFQ